MVFLKKIINCVKVLSKEKSLIMIEVKFEYVLHTSPKIIYKLLSTPSGLTEWFADDILVEGDVYTFVWDGHGQAAKVYKKPHDFFVRYDWVDEEGRFISFKIQYNKVSKDSDLIITDFVDDEDEIEDLKNLWEPLYVSNAVWVCRLK